jgi:hypothetical protein
MNKFKLINLITFLCFFNSLIFSEEKTLDFSKPVKVYILLGQSNMFGFGKISGADQRGTLEYITQKEKKYTNVVDKSGQWAVRKDVRFVHVMQGKGKNGKFNVLRNEWLTVGGNAEDAKGPFTSVGPELQMGHLLGDYHEEPVLILKACIGNRSLGWDYLPPGSERYEYRGKIYAGYRDTGNWTKSEQPKTNWQDGAWYAGKQYDDDTANAKAVLNDLGKFFPGAKSYEVVGFAWWQGHKDTGSKIHASRYELNLVNFIKALRKDFKVPNAKFVLSTIAFGGRKIAGNGLTIVKAQLAVSGDKGKYPDFKGNVKAFDALKFWQPGRRSPGGGGHHYNGNALTYMDVGNGLGKSMIELLDAEKSK